MQKLIYNSEIYTNENIEKMCNTNRKNIRIKREFRLRERKYFQKFYQ